MKPKLICLFFVLLISGCSESYSPPVSSQTTEINKSNWNEHPKILEINSIQSEISGLLESGKLIKTTKEYDDQESGGSWTEEIYSSESGVVRFLNDLAGTGDYQITTGNYYDRSGNLIFVNLVYKNAENAVHTYRMYFSSETGDLLWEVHSITDYLTKENLEMGTMSTEEGMGTPASDMYLTRSIVHFEDLITRRPN